MKKLLAKTLNPSSLKPLPATELDNDLGGMISMYKMMDIKAAEMIQMFEWIYQGLGIIICYPKNTSLKNLSALYSGGISNFNTDRVPQKDYKIVWVYHNGMIYFFNRKYYKNHIDPDHDKGITFHNFIWKINAMEMGIKKGFQGFRYIRKNMYEVWMKNFLRRK